MPMKIGTQMPSLAGATEWFNATGARAEAEAQEHPTLVYFWSVGCDDCKESIGRVAEFRDGYEAAGLRVVAVHTPHAPSDEDTETVRDCVTTCNMTEPCAVDNEHKLSAAFEHEPAVAPAFYLFDADGRLVEYASGTNGLETIAPALSRLLGASAPGDKHSLL